MIPEDPIIAHIVISDAHPGVGAAGAHIAQRIGARVDVLGEAHGIVEGHLLDLVLLHAHGGQRGLTLSPQLFGGVPARLVLVPPAAPFLSTAKEMGERTPPKTHGFWISFRRVTPCSGSSEMLN